MPLFKAVENSSFKTNLLNYLMICFSSIFEAVLSYVFYFLYLNETCSNHFPIQTWILVNAIYFTSSIGLNLFIFGNKYRIFAILYDLNLIIEISFNIVWSVVGSVVLFKSNCIDINPNIWGFALFSLLFYWISIPFLAWAIITRYKN